MEFPVSFSRHIQTRTCSEEKRRKERRISGRSVEGRLHGVERKEKVDLSVSET